MASVSAVELEQKTSEYFTYVKALFESTESDHYKTSVADIRLIDGVLTLQYSGK